MRVYLINVALIVHYNDRWGFTQTIVTYARQRDWGRIAQGGTNAKSHHEKIDNPLSDGDELWQGALRFKTDRSQGVGICLLIIIDEHKFDFRLRHQRLPDVGSAFHMRQLAAHLEGLGF